MKQVFGYILFIIGTSVMVGFGLWYYITYAHVLTYYEYRMVMIYNYWYIWLPGFIVATSGILIVHYD